MDPINLAEILLFEKDISACFKKRGIDRSPVLANDFSLNFVYEKYIEEDLKKTHKHQLAQWFNFISFLLIVFPDLKPSTGKFILGLYSSIENAYLLISFLRTSSALAVLRGVYENILKLLFILHGEASFDFDVKKLKNIVMRNNGLQKDLKELTKEEEFVAMLFGAYGELCKHSHVNIVQPEQIIQEEYIQKLIDNLNDCGEIFNRTINLCNAYLLMMFPETLFKHNANYISTNLVRKTEEKIFRGIKTRFYYVDALPDQPLKDLVRAVSLSPEEEHEKFHLGEIYLMVDFVEDAHKLFMEIIDSQFFTKNPGHYVVVLLSCDLNKDKDLRKRIISKILEQKIAIDYLKTLLEEYKGKYKVETDRILDELKNA